MRFSLLDLFLCFVFIICLLCGWQLCVGKYSCSIDVSEQILGPTGCAVDTRRLAVEAIC